MSVDATIATWKLPKNKVTAIQKLLLLSLADRAGENSECWPSLARLVADTNLNIKTIKENRQALINMGLIEYTGQKKGRQRQIPVMRLTYVQNREEFTEPKNGPGQNFTEPKNGLGTEPKNGLLNLKEEPKNNTSERSSPVASIFEDPTPLNLVSVFAEELPESPQPVVHAITKSIDQKSRVAITEFKKYWLARIGKPLTVNNFRAYLRGLKEDCPGFLAEYMNKNGLSHKNGIKTILHWETFEKYLNKTIF